MALDDIINYDNDGAGRPAERIYISPMRSGEKETGTGLLAPGDYDVPAAVSAAPPALSRTVQGQGDDLPSMIARLRDYLLNPTGFSEGNPTANWVATRLSTDMPGEPRYQTWPEKMVRSGVSLARDVATGEEPMQVIDPVSGEVVLSPTMIGRTMDMAGLAGGGALTERPGGATLGSGPVRRQAMTEYDRILARQREAENVVPAVRDPVTGKVYTEGANHSDIMENVTDPDAKGRFTSLFKDMAAGKGEAVDKYTDSTGFLVNGKFVKRRDFENGMQTADSVNNRSKTAMFRSDTQQPGAAVAAARNARAPSLRSAVKFEGKVYPADRPGGAVSHAEIFPDAVYERMQEKGLEFPDELPGVESGFVDERGRYLTREQAGHYAEDMGLVRPEYKGIARKGGLGSEMLLSDTQQPGAAVAAAKSASPFYSALEHAATNAKQDVMTPEQWLGWLKNQPGVKGEEMQWTGLDRWLSEQNGKVSKGDVQKYLDEHKVELKEVTKGGQQAQAYNDREIDDAAHERAVEAVREAFHQQNPRMVGREGTNRYEAAFERFGESRAGEDAYNAALESQFEPEGSVRYSDYQLPGGENYREHLLTLPQQLPDPVQIGPGRWTVKLPGESLRDVGSWDTPAQATKAAKDMTQTSYRSSHWDEPNVLAHVRTNERDVGAKPTFTVVNTKSGNRSQPFATREEADAMASKIPNTRVMEGSEPVKSLHIEEIQSDWHQQGRKTGYATKDSPEEKPGWTSVGPGKVPDAPFKTAWPELALKRMIRMAAEEGKGRISWTPGEAQAARYDLSKHVNEITVIKHDDGGTTWWPKNTTGQDMGSITTDAAGKIVKAQKETWRDAVGKNIDEVVGKDVAKKGMEATDKETKLTGTDLKVGGEGMKGFYDNMLPKMVEKLGKPYGVKVKQHQPPVPEIREIPRKEYTVGPAQWHPELPEAMRKPDYHGLYANGEFTGENHPTRGAAELAAMGRNKINRGDRFEVEAADGNYKYFKTRKDAEQWLEKHKPAPVWYFDIPPAMKDAALSKGFPLFTSGMPFPLVPVDHNPFEKKKERK